MCSLKFTCEKFAYDKFVPMKKLDRLKMNLMSESTCLDWGALNLTSNNIFPLPLSWPMSVHIHSMWHVCVHIKCVSKGPQKVEKGMA